MSTHLERTIDIAAKVTSMAEDALRGLDISISAWPGEYRAIVWHAVATIAANRAADAKNER